MPTNASLKVVGFDDLVVLAESVAGASVARPGPAPTEKMQRWLPALLRRAAPALSSGSGGGGSARLFASSLLLFDDTQVQFKESVRKFAQDAIAPHAAAIDASNHFPRDVDLWRLMGDFSLHGLTTPEEYGGMGTQKSKIQCVYMPAVMVRTSEVLGFYIGYGTNASSSAESPAGSTSLPSSTSLKVVGVEPVALAQAT